VLLPEVWKTMVDTCGPYNSGGSTIAVKVSMSSWWNDWAHVGSGRGSRAPVDYARSHPSHRRERVL
jgi:hypothetical protein